VRKEDLTIDGELGSTRGASEQQHAEVFLQGSNSFGYRLLRDGQRRGGFLELTRVCDRHECAHGIEIHAAICRSTTDGCRA